MEKLELCFLCEQKNNPYNQNDTLIKIYWMQQNDGSNIPKFKEDDFDYAHEECAYIEL